MTKRLLDRQASLLKYLTSGAAILGNAKPALDHNLRGLDSRLLHLEARFSHNKRMDKIIAVLPRTFEILGDGRAIATQEFAKACPPADINRLADASQFCDFLSTRRQAGLEPPYLPDVAACELALAKVRAHNEVRDEDVTRRKSGHIRRNPATILLRCAYDIQTVFEEHATSISPPKRDTALAVSMPPTASTPRVFELHPIAFDLLIRLKSWADPTEFGETPEMQTLIAELLEHRLIEVDA
jgi:hypothetical protein